MRIRELRKQRQLTQVKLAAEIGWERGTIAAVETGGALPGRELVAALATFFGVSVDYILGREPSGSDLMLDDREQEVIDLFRRSPESARQNILGILKTTSGIR